MLRARVLLAIVLLGASGCGASSRSANDRQRRRLEARALETSLDRLEERLLVDQARARFWRELQQRHESVSAIACTNLDRHAQSSALLEERHRAKREAGIATERRLAESSRPRGRARANDPRPPRSP